MIKGHPTTSAHTHLHSLLLMHTAGRNTCNRALSTLSPKYSKPNKPSDHQFIIACHASTCYHHHEQLSMGSCRRATQYTCILRVPAKRVGVVLYGFVCHYVLYFVASAASNPQSLHFTHMLTFFLAAT